MAQLNKGTTYSTGDQVTAANLNALVDNAALQPGAITEQIAASSLTTADSTLLSQPLGLRKVTLGQIQSLISPVEGTFLKADGSVSMTTGQQLTLGSTTQISPLNAVSLGYLENNFLKRDGSVAMTTGQQLTLGSTAQIAPLNAVSLGHLQANYATSSVGFDAKVVFNGAFSSASVVTFTYVKTAETVVITCNNHGFFWQNVAYFDFTSASGTTVADGDYYIDLLNLTTNTFQITLTTGTTGNGSGTGTFRRCAIQASTRVSQVNPRGTTAGNGYWVNLNYTYYLVSQMLAFVSVSNANQGSVAYAVVDKYNTAQGAVGRTDSSISLQPYTAAGALVDSGSYTGVLFTGGAIRP